MKHLIAILIVGSSILTYSANQCKLQKTTLRFKTFSDYILDSQQKIISILEEEDGYGKFVQDPWGKIDENSGDLSGHGITSVIQKGEFIEKVIP